MTKFKPLIKFNSGWGAILCNKCRTIVKDNLTIEEMHGNTKIVLCQNCLQELVYGFKTQNKEGFTFEEQKKLLSMFTKINMKRYNEALTGITCSGNYIYHCDILTALRCGMEDRNMKSYEWD
jgi:hypothetical protein